MYYRMLLLFLTGISWLLTDLKSDITTKSKTPQCIYSYSSTRRRNGMTDKTRYYNLSCGLQKIFLAKTPNLSFIKMRFLHFLEIHVKSLTWLFLNVNFSALWKIIISAPFKLFYPPKLLMTDIRPSLTTPSGTLAQIHLSFWKIHFEELHTLSSLPLLVSSLSLPSQFEGCFW